MITTNNIPTITIAAPVRNRAWILPYYLKSIFDLNYPKENIDLFFVVNDSNDESLTFLQDFKNKHTDIYRKIRLEVYNRKVPIDHRDLSTRSNHIYEHLSKLKNFIKSRVKTDYLFFVDTDILLPSDTINNLLNHQKDIVSCLIWNGYIENSDKPYLYPNIMRNENGLFRHIVNCDVKSAPHTTVSNLLEVDLTGAAIMLSREAYKSVKYGFHPQGEDAYFCKMAQDKGFELFCDLGIFAHHIMNENLLREYFNEKESNTLSANPGLGLLKATSPTDTITVR